MPDNLHRYFAIRNALTQLRPTAPTRSVTRHLSTLAMLLSGILGSHKCHLPAIANKVPTTAKPQSRIRQMERFLANERIDHATYYLPYIETLLQSLPPGPLVLVIDGSDMGRNCVLLSINVVYKKRTLPLCWLVVTGKKGHLGEETHIQLVNKVAPLLPKERGVVFLGDGEFDGIELLGTLAGWGWRYVCRTAKNVVLYEGDARFQPSDLFLQPGDCIELPEVGFTQAKYGPVLVCVVWERGWKEPLVLVSNLDFVAEAYPFYRQRFRIETFFSDQKSRGFYVCHSHISDTAHLDRLLIAAFLAYVWLVCLGEWVVQTGQVSRIHRADRCDWSLFRLGLVWVEYCLDQGLVLWMQFSIPRETTLKTVG